MSHITGCQAIETTSFNNLRPPINTDKY